MNKRKIVDVPRPGDTVHIPLSEKDAIRLAFKVKSNESMPKPGAHATGPKKKRARKKPAKR
jgi:hypothetical protein